MLKHLQKDMENLKNKLIAMGGQVEDQVSKATQSVIKRDEELAKGVILADTEIDQMEVDIEEHCLKILVLYQPVATDLRFIVTVLKINVELERIGDIAVNIAERGAFLATQDEIKIPFDIEKMASKVESMLSRSIDALVNLDVRLARKIRAEDEEVDDQLRAMYASVTDVLVENPDQTKCLLHIVSASRHLERIADHAANICEDVIYLVDAEIVRHKSEII